jgi:hypothetical protein
MFNGMSLLKQVDHICFASYELQCILQMMKSKYPFKGLEMIGSNVDPVL